MLNSIPDAQGISAPAKSTSSEVTMIGTPSQVEWADRIRPQVNAEFDRVAKALTVAASGRGAQVQADTTNVIAILEEKRAEVMARNQAGYFIRDWQELNDQVRQMIGNDSRFQAIKARKAARIESMRLRESEARIQR